jgi:hypothetical protein
MRNIMSSWPGMIASQLDSAESIFTFLMPMACALLGFYMILKAVPQFASSIMTGGVSGMDGGMIKAAAMAGYGLGIAVLNGGRTIAQTAIGAGSAVSQSARTYAYTSQASLDTGSTPSEARAAGAREALKTIMTGPQAGGPHAAGDRIYSNFQRGAQFADSRESSSNNLSSPASASANGVNQFSSEGASDSASSRETDASTDPLGSSGGGSADEQRASGDGQEAESGFAGDPSESGQSGESVSGAGTDAVPSRKSFELAEDKGGSATVNQTDRRRRDAASAKEALEAYDTSRGRGRKEK